MDLLPGKPIGSYRIWTADTTGNAIDPPDAANPSKAPNPADPLATDIYFGLNGAANQPPPKDQIDLQGNIAKVLRCAQRIYLEGEERRETKFRTYYVRLFRLAQLGLEGENSSSEVATGALAAVTADLIDDEAARVKNGHLVVLGRHAITFTIPFAVAYCVIRILPPPMLDTLHRWQIDSTMLASFMLLWMGCFLGVWLSYGLRTSVFTLSDLTTTDTDRLLPQLRLIFAGALTMIVGLVIVLGFIEVKVGEYSLADMATTRPMLAYLVGVFCGISELSLPSTVSKRASELMSKLN